jgi:hypothetical protein
MDNFHTYNNHTNIPCHKVLDQIYYKIKKDKEFTSSNLDETDFPTALFMIMLTVQPLIYTENTKSAVPNS